MNNNQLLPFERNRYYPGKMLTSMDFQAEQLYMNNKRRFMNNALFGSGIVNGLGVMNLDDLSIMVESGVAIDGRGREIVMPKSVVKKLSAIEGFSTLTTNKAELCIRFREEHIHPVYSIVKKEDGEEYECNRVHEDYELYLKDVSNADSEDKEYAYLSKELFLSEEDYRVTLLMPSVVTKGKRVRLIVKIEKLSERQAILNFKGTLQLPVMRGEDESHEIIINGKDVNLPKGGIIEQEYWVYAEHVNVDETNIILRSKSGQGKIDDRECEINESLNLRISLTNTPPEHLALSLLGKESYEKRSEKSSWDVVKLAEFSLLRTDDAYVIDSVKEIGVKNYIYTPIEAFKRSDYLGFFRQDSTVSQNIQMGINRKNESSRFMEQAKYAPDMTSIITGGSIEIPLEVGMKKGDICYSEEIMHGLGKGHVYIAVGIPSVETDSQTGRDTKTTIYGDVEMFKDKSQMWVQTAVKVFNDKGSFKVAAKLTGEQQSIVLLVDWTAIRFMTLEESRMEESCNDMRIIPDAATVKIPSGTNFCFHVRFENMKPCRLTYELTEKGSGEIRNDGVYTAPSRKGVYEIHIFCTDVPEVSTYVYAIVE